MLKPLDIMSLFRKIINLFMHNPMPDSVQEHFSYWMLSSKNAGLKNAALEEEWNAMCENYREDSVSSVARWTRLRQIHKKMSEQKPSGRGVFVPWQAAAACVAAFVALCAVPFFVGAGSSEDQLTCYVTSSSGKGEFTLPDGSHVWLNSDSRLEFCGDLSGKVREVSLKGEAFFDVMPSDKYFIVDMGGIDVKVLGTEFNARNSESYGDYQVTLRSGKVQVESEHFKPVVLSPGQQFQASGTLASASVRKVNTDNYTSWTGEELVFENRRLSTVLTNLEHWYNINIDTSPEVDTDVRLSLTVRHESIDKTLDLIGTIAGCGYSYVGEDAILITK